MIYIDTSVWIAQHTLETHTEAVQAWFSSNDVAAMSSCEWVKTEYASALSIKLRKRAFDRRAFDAAHARFAELCAAGPLWLGVADADFTEAARLCGNPESGLRAGDALHLAVALRMGCEALCSLDDVLLRNAGQLGLQPVRP